MASGGTKYVLPNQGLEENTFKMTLLGRAGVGKTSLCAQLVSHDFSPVYTHTTQCDAYITVVEKTSEDRIDGSRIIRGKGGKPLNTYKVEMQDTPGEVDTAIKSNTLEAKLVSEEATVWSPYMCRFPRPANILQDRQPDGDDDDDDDNGDGDDFGEQKYGDSGIEASPLLPQRGAVKGPDPLKQSAPANQLFGFARINMGFIVMFDVALFSQSFPKAKKLVEKIRLNVDKAMVNAAVPIVLFGNKHDVLDSEQDIIKQGLEFLDSASLKWNTTAKRNTIFAYGSVKCNYAIFPTLGGANPKKKYRLEQVLHVIAASDLVQRNQESVLGGLVSQIYNAYAEKKGAEQSGKQGADAGDSGASKGPARGHCRRNCCYWTFCFPCAFCKCLAKNCCGSKDNGSEDRGKLN